MGYDFMFLRLNDREVRHFPLQSDALIEADCEGPLPWPVLRSWLISRGGRENGHIDSIWVDYKDGGSINFRGKADSVYLDVHSDWANVLESFRFLIGHERDCGIFDPQSGEFHDETSFRALMRPSDPGA